MSVTYGFFDSLNGDRKYSAADMSNIFNGIINDGVFDNVGDMMTVKAPGGMYVTVGSGRAWFNGKWTYIDTEYPLLITDVPPINSRIVAVVLEINLNTAARQNSIKLISGDIAGSPVPPTLQKSGNIYQYPLAYVTVKAGAKEITNSNIRVMVGTSSCPFVTGILKTTNISALFTQWDGEFNDWLNDNTSEISTWFADFKTTLSKDDAANLLLRVRGVEESMALMRSVTKVTLPVNSWTYTAPFIQSFVLTDCKSTDSPIIEAMTDGVANNNVEDYLEECGYITKFITGKKVVNGAMVDADNYVTAYCATDRPTMALTFGVKGR